MNHYKLSWPTAGEAATKNHCQNQVGFQRERSFGFWVVKDGGEKRKLFFLKEKLMLVPVCLLGTYIMTTALVPLLEKAADARVVSL